MFPPIPLAGDILATSCEAWGQDFKTTEFPMQVEVEANQHCDLARFYI